MKRSTWWRSPNDSSPDEDLRPYFDALRETDYQESFDPMMHWLERTRQPRPLALRFILSKVIHMTTYLCSHRLQLAVASLFLAVIFAACTLPVEQEETLGYLLSGTIEGAQAKKTLDDFSQLDWIDPAQMNAEVRFSSSKGMAIQFAIVQPEAEHDDITRRADALRAVDGVTGVQIQPLDVTVERPAYKAAFRSVTGKSGAWTTITPHSELETELEAIVARHLDDLSMHGIEVKHVTLPSGTRALMLSAPVSEFSVEGKRSLERLMSDINPPKASEDDRRAFIFRRDVEAGNGEDGAASFEQQRSEGQLRSQKELEKRLEAEKNHQD